MAGIDAVRCVGWLLRVNRRLGPDPELRSGHRFARAFRRDTSRPLAPSHVTRWENGDLALSRATIRRYEQLLGLPPESMATVHDALVRLAGGSPLPPPGGAPGSGADEQRLHDLIDRASSTDAMTGVAWGELTERIAQRSGILLHPPDIWGRITERLLSELVVAEKVAWLQRQEAMSRLVEHPVAGRYAIAACIALADDRNTAAVVEPLSLLDVTGHPAANQYVLRQLRSPDSDRARYGALLASIAKVHRGHFGPADLPILTDCVAQIAAEVDMDQDQRYLLAEVTRMLRRRAPAHLSLPLRQLPAELSDDNPGGDRAALAVCQRIAAQAQARLVEVEVDGGPDEDLVALVRQLLFDRNFDRRLATTMLIAVSPYRDPVAQAMLASISGGGGSISGGGGSETAPMMTTLRALTVLGVDIHRPLLHELLTRPGTSDETRHAAAWATPHCGGSYQVVQWRRMLAVQHASWRQHPSSLRESILSGLVYGIGTDSHPELLAEIRADQTMPESVRVRAAVAARPAQPLR